MESNTGKRERLIERSKQNLNDSRKWQQTNSVDTTIIIVVVLMLAFGLVMLFSASMSDSIIESETGTSYLARQLVANVIGIGFMVWLSKFNLKIFDRLAFAAVVYMIGVILLFLTLFTRPINGARRWLSIPIFGTFQPSEFMKVAIVYIIACYESWLFKQRAAGRFQREAGLRGAIKDAGWDLLIPAGIVAIPVGIMSLQTHMSGIFIILIVSLATLLAAGLPWRSWLTATVIGISFIALFALFIFSIWDFLPEKITGRFGHVFTRIDIFTGDSNVTADELYQSNQAYIAIGSGGWTGVGLGQGKQKNRYLPEVHNDYIFSNIVEETGFIGGLVVIVLFLVFFLLGMRIAHKSSSVYAQIVATGISTLITLQAMLNVAVNVGAIPPTGISLPFFSYGGTSNMFFLIGIGLLLNVSKFGVREES